MLIQFDSLEVTIVEAKTKRDAREYGFTGWCWHELRRRPVGPFSSAAEAIRDLADRIDNDTLPEPSVRKPRP